MLPAGNFLKDQQTQFVARIKEVRRLRIVRGAHQVALERVLEDFCVFFLRPAAHGVTDIGEGLMPVQTANFQLLAVEEEAFRSETSGAKTEACRQFIAAMSGRQRELEAIQTRRVELPKIQPGKVLKRDPCRLARDFDLLLVEHTAINGTQFGKQRSGHRMTARIV